MKHILITAIAAVLLVGCSKSEEQGFAQQPLVVSGGTGNIVQANPEKVAQDDPVLRAAHFRFVVDPSLEAHVMDEFEGNVPDKFFLAGRENIQNRRKKICIEIFHRWARTCPECWWSEIRTRRWELFSFPHSLRSNFVCGSTARCRHHRKRGIRKSSVAGQRCVRCSSVARADSKSFANCHSGSKSESTF